MPPGVVADLDKSIIIMDMPVIIKMLSYSRLIPLKHPTPGELRRTLGMTPKSFKIFGVIPSFLLNSPVVHI